MALRLPAGAPRGPRIQGLFNGVVSVSASAPPPSPLTLCRQPTMRFSIRRRRPAEPFRRDVHSQQRQKTRPQQDRKGLQWFSIPLSVGIGVVGLVHLYRSYRTSSPRGDEEKERVSHVQEKGEREEIREDSSRRPRKRPRIRPDGPWSVRLHLIPAASY